jgi:hypothetical protein
MATSHCRSSLPVSIHIAPDPLGSPGEATAQRLVAAHERAAERSPSTNESKFHLGIGELGIGVFASGLIRQGEPILEFRGSPMSFAEAVALGDGQCYALQIGLDREYINLDEPGRFVNHSCSPNAGLRGLTLHALRDLRGGEEIRFDYSTTMAEDYWEMPCRCGSPECRGRVRDFRHLPAPIQQRYRELGIAAPFLA